MAPSVWLSREHRGNLRPRHLSRAVDGALSGHQHHRTSLRQALITPNFRVESLAFPFENELYVAKILNCRVQKLILEPVH